MHSNNLTGSIPENTLWRNTESINNVYSYSPSLVAFLVSVNIAEIVLTILGNLTVILTVVAYRQLWVPSNILVASLAVADLAIGFILQTSNALNLWNTLLRAKRPCGSLCVGFMRTAGFVTLTVSLVHLSLITLDRFAAIVYPLRYVTIMTMSRTRKALVFAWTTSIVFGFLATIPSPVSNGARALWYFFILITCMFIITLYGRLYCISRKHAKRIQHEFHSVNPKAETYKEERRGLMTFRIITMTMVISYVPNVILGIDENLASPDRGDDAKLVHDVVRQIAIVLILFNSAINPLVYFFRSEKLRAYSWKLLKSIPRRVKEYICM